jgi:hypothetical protein
MISIFRFKKISMNTKEKKSNGNVKERNKLDNTKKIRKKTFKNTLI